MNSESTVNEKEKAKFDDALVQWWNVNGPLKTLHDINPARVTYIEQHVALANCDVLDVGCGGGILSEALAKQAKHVTGIDVAQSAINTAKDHAKSSELTIDYKCTPIELFPDQKFDVITCLEMLEHVDSPELVIQHCHRLLKDDGWLFLSTINRSPIAYAQVIVAAEYILNLLPRQTHDYKKFIKPSELASICRTQGFEIYDIKGLNYNPISRTAWVGGKPTVNYLMICKKC